MEIKIAQASPLSRLEARPSTTGRRSISRRRRTSCCRAATAPPRTSWTCVPWRWTVSPRTTCSRSPTSAAASRSSDSPPASRSSASVRWGLSRDLSLPSAITLFALGDEVIIAVGDSGAAQRLQLFTLQGALLASIGGKGPLLGQFRDITALSVFVPHSLKRECARGEKVLEKEYRPCWFLGESDLEELENALLDENLQSNFVIGQRFNDHAQYDVLYISPSQSIDRFVLRRDESDRANAGFRVTNLLLYSEQTQPKLFPSLLDFVKSHKSLLKVRKDARAFVLFAVNDRKNFRVQIIKYFFTKSKIYRPSLEVIASVGGIKAIGCELRDPVAISFSAHGELAVCDNGRNVVVLLSRQYSVIKTISLPFVSMQQLLGANANRSRQRRNQLTERELDNSRKPCDVAFLPTGQLVLGYKSGGIYIFQANRVAAVGDLEQLESDVLGLIICDFLPYEDVASLRNCSRFLHNFTRELRLSFKIFPPPRRKMLNKVLSLFLSWARVGAQGVDRLDHLLHSLTDKFNHPICRQYLVHCSCVLYERGQCSASHLEVDYDRFEINASEGYLTFDDFEFFLSELFGPKFMWRFELYIRELFDAYSVEKMIVLRKDKMSRRNEVVREQMLTPTKVLTYSPYIELMALLEEEFSGFKSLKEHKLFTGKGRGRFLPKVPTNYESLENKSVFSNPLEQYEHKGIEVPPAKYMQGKRFITRDGFQNAEHKEDSEAKEHIAVVAAHTERVATLIDKLFS